MGKSYRASVTFYDSNGIATETVSGAVDESGNSIEMPLPWTRFSGKLSGLWRGPGSAEDYYVVAHDELTGEVRIQSALVNGRVQCTVYTAVRSANGFILCPSLTPLTNSSPSGGT